MVGDKNDPIQFATGLEIEDHLNILADAMAEIYARNLELDDPRINEVLHGVIEEVNELYK